MIDHDGFHVVYCDPPWSYRDKKRAGRTKSGAENHYPCMAEDEIRSLPVGEVAHENSVLFLWATWPLLLDQRNPARSLPGRVMRSWGYEYRTVAFVWVKLNADGSPWHGVGSYAKSNTEMVLMGVRGKVGRLLKRGGKALRPHPDRHLRVTSNGVSQLVMARRGSHSRKPPQVRARIETLFGDGRTRRLELFARQRRRGWTSLGHDVGTEVGEALRRMTRGL